jgi:hypothetical protein
MRRLALVAVLALTAGCASATLPYKPDPQPDGARISAAYQILADRLRIEIDTDHRRVEDVWIHKPDGTALRALAIDNAPVVTGPPPTIGVGVGSGGYRGGIGIGTGLSVGIPVGQGASRIEGNTWVTFALDQAGPPPWRLHLKVAGVAPVIIVVGGPVPAR